MLKYANTQVVFQEFPGETTLAINLTNCPHKCPGCHSPHLWKDEGTILDMAELSRLVTPIEHNITCIGFMGGDNDVPTLLNLVEAAQLLWPWLKMGWYSGDDFWSDQMMEPFDYVKFGSYKKDLGGLNSKTTNQVMYKYIEVCDRWLDITKYFQTKDIDYHNMVIKFEGFIRAMLVVQKTGYASPGVLPPEKPGDECTYVPPPKIHTAEELFDIHKQTLEIYFNGLTR